MAQPAWQDGSRHTDAGSGSVRHIGIESERLYPRPIREPEHGFGDILLAHEQQVVRLFVTAQHVLRHAKIAESMTLPVVLNLQIYLEILRHRLHETGHQLPETGVIRRQKNNTGSGAGVCKRNCKQEQETDQQAGWIRPHETNHPLEDLPGLAFVEPKLPTCRVTDKRRCVTEVSVQGRRFSRGGRLFKFDIELSGQLFIDAGVFQALHLGRQASEELPVGLCVVTG